MKTVTDRSFHLINALLSGAAISFLFWLIYLREVTEVVHPVFLRLPAVNASLNASSAFCLIMGFLRIKKKKVEAHRFWMISAFIFSSLFLVCYILYHAAVGDTRFTGHGPVRALYFFILISHIVLSVFALPMILTTFYQAFRGRFPIHRKWARVTFPIWLYVSVTGVLIFVLLRSLG